MLLILRCNTVKWVPDIVGILRLSNVIYSHKTGCIGAVSDSSFESSWYKEKDQRGDGEESYEVKYGTHSVVYFHKSLVIAEECTFCTPILYLNAYYL